MIDLSDLQMVYVIHFESLTNRRKVINSQLSKITGIPVTFITMNEDSDHQTSKIFKDVYKGDSKVSVQEITVSLAHLQVYRDILDKGYSTCLILEDDAILVESFLEDLEKSIKESVNFDFSFLSSCGDLRAHKVRPGILQDALTSRSVCGYIVRSQCLAKVLTACSELISVIDWQLNYIREPLGLKYSWSEPPIVLQGSEKEYESRFHSLRCNR